MHWLKNCSFHFFNFVAHFAQEEPALAVASLDRAITLWPEYLKAVARRAALNEQLSNLDEALRDYNIVLQLSPGHREAGQAVFRLPPLIEERNEKLKQEMMGEDFN